MILVQEKVNQAIDILKEFEVDCWITFVRESELGGDPTLDYILGSSVTWHSVFILTASGQRYAIVGEYDKKTVEDTGAYTQVLSYVEGIKDLFLNCMKEIAPSQIAVNYSQDSEICDGITHGMYLTLYGFLEELRFEDRIIPAEQIVSALRQRKTPTEIHYIKEAIARTEDIFAHVATFIQPGKTEQEIADFMKDEVKKTNLGLAWNVKNCPAVLTGPKAVRGHCTPTDRKAEGGHLLNIDFGVNYQGYCSDLQRTFYILKPNETAPPPEVQQTFEDTVHAIEHAKQALKPGAQGIEIDHVARNYLTSCGYEEFHCALGHQVGRFAHDGTALLGPAWEKYAQKPFQIIEEGMVFTLEPHASVPGYGVVALEDMVLVTEDGAEFISTPQKKLLVIKNV